MHWAYRIAEELIRKHANRETFVCASGISPSGSVHIGNFREVVTTFFVASSLAFSGKSARIFKNGMMMNLEGIKNVPPYPVQHVLTINI